MFEVGSQAASSQLLITKSVLRSQTLRSVTQSLGAERLLEGKRGQIIRHADSQCSLFLTLASEDA